MSDEAEQGGIIQNAPIKGCVARVNIPDPRNPGWRIVGYRVPATAALVEPLFALERRDNGAAEVAAAVAAEREACAVAAWCSGMDDFGAHPTAHDSREVGARAASRIRARASGGDALAAHTARVRREALEEAARVVQCGCPNAEAVAAAALEYGKNGGPRWRLCGKPHCGALDAAAIRALIGGDDAAG